MATEGVPGQTNSLGVKEPAQEKVSMNSVSDRELSGVGDSAAKQRPPVTNGMKELLQKGEELFTLPRIGDVIDGRVIEKGRNRIFFDLGALRLGVVYRSEIDLSLYDVQGIGVGDTLPVKVLSLENEDGLVELSLREAGLDRVWQELEQMKAKGEAQSINVVDANRGGLIAELRGVTGFLPVSQLSPEHYPHVEGGDKEEIFRRLKKFIGETIEVKILDLDRKTAKLIFSERAKVSKEIREKLAHYAVGQIVEGEVSGIVDFGAFITFDGIEGLVHISELGWQLVEHPEDVVTLGQKVSAKVIALEDDKVSLSLKALRTNPWDEVGKIYKVGDIIEGQATKYNPFGAFVRVAAPTGVEPRPDESGRGPEIQGLTHISEFASYEQMVSALALGETHRFSITMLDPKEYKMALRPLDIPGAGAQKAGSVENEGDVGDVGDVQAKPTPTDIH